MDQPTGAKKRMLEILDARWAVGEAAKNNVTTQAKLAMLAATGALVLAMSAPLNVAYAETADAVEADAPVATQTVDSSDEAKAEPKAEAKAEPKVEAAPAEEKAATTEATEKASEAVAEEQVAEEAAKAETPAVEEEATQDAATKDEPVKAATVEEASSSEEAVAVTTQSTGVCKIGDVEYDTLDEAVAAAADGDTITLTADCDLTKVDLKGRTLTIAGAYTVSGDKALNITNGGLTFKDCTVNLAPVTGTTNGLAIGITLKGTLALDNATFNLDGAACGTNTHGIYATGSNCAINLTNGSTLKITNFKQDAIEWDGTYRYEMNMSGGSSYIADNNRSAITGTWYVTMVDSTQTWTNCSGNGSNGAHYDMTNSTVTVDTCGAHGFSVGNLTMKNNSTVTSTKAKYAGIWVGQALTADGTSTITATDNAYGYTGAGIKLASKTATNLVQSGAVVTITGTVAHEGLANNGNTTFEDGVKLTITGNTNTSDNGGGIFNSATGVINLPANAIITNNSAVKTGGGILNAGTIVMPASVQLYNNHAGTAGDDVYLRAGATITLPAIGSWTLDGSDDGYTCDDAIDGWYLDDENNRWNYVEDGNHNKIEGVEAENYQTTYEAQTTITAENPIAIKAAHAEIPELVPEGDTVPPKPEGTEDEGDKGSDDKSGKSDKSDDKASDTKKSVKNATPATGEGDLPLAPVAALAAAAFLASRRVAGKGAPKHARF